MLDKLTKIANTLDQKGLYDEANIIDNIIKNAIANHFLIPDDQLNIENQGYAGGESRIGGGYSGLAIDEGMRAEDNVIPLHRINADLDAKLRKLTGFGKGKWEKTGYHKFPNGTIVYGGEYEYKKHRKNDEIIHWEFVFATDIERMNWETLKNEKFKNMYFIRVMKNEPNLYKYNTIFENIYKNPREAFMDLVKYLDMFKPQPKTKEPDTSNVIPLFPVEQDNVDIAVHSNGLRGNTSLDDQNSAMQQGLSDAYFYTGYQNLEGRFGPQDR